MSFLGPLLALTLLLQGAFGDSVPALLWSNQANAPEAVSHLSTLVDQIEPADLLSEYAERKVRVVALVQEDLNVEQFAANDAPFVSAIFDKTAAHPAFFTNVKNPRKVFSLYKDAAEGTGSDNVVIYLPGKSLKENDEAIKLYNEKFNASGPVVFMLTGEKNDFMREINRIRRAAEEDKKETAEVKVLTHNAENGSPCLIITTSGATATLLKKDSKAEVETKTFANPQIDANGDTKCVNEKDAGRAEKLTLKMDSLSITWELTTSAESTWEISPLKVTIDNQNFPVRKNQRFSSSKIFSYSCQKESIKLDGEGGYASGTLTIEGFQIQPFHNGTKESPVRFLDSQDCAVWFTLPIFSGLIIVLLLITILYFGVIALMSISTPDRFENPKGKTLIISNFDE